MSYPPPPGGPEGGQPGGQPPYGPGPPPPPPPWGPGPGYGYGMVPQDHPKGTTTLVLGLVGVIGGLACTLPIFLCIPAWVIGHQARRDIQQNPGAYGNSGMVTAGWILGIVGTCLLILGVLLVLIIFIAVVASG